MFACANNFQGTDNLYTGDQLLNEDFNYLQLESQPNYSRFVVLHSYFEASGIVDQIELFACTKGYIKLQVSIRGIH